MAEDIKIDNSAFGMPSAEADTLIIEVSKTDYAFCEYNSKKNKLLFAATHHIDFNSIEKPEEQLIRGLNLFQLSKKNHTNIFINHHHSNFTLCPEPFYNINNGKELLEFNIGNVDQQIIKTNDINNRIKIIYSVDENISNLIDAIFPQHQSKHTLCVLSQLLLTYEDLTHEDVLVYIKDDSLSLLIKNKQTLLLTNTYAIKSTEDILYYLLFSLEQYELNPLFVKIVLIGNINTASPLANSIKKYIKHVRFGIGNKLIDWTEVKGMPQHYYYSILNRLFCEL